MTKPAGSSVSSGDAKSPAEPQVTVFLVNATRTSAGPGPGALRLPAVEAGRLIAARLAVYGDRNPEAADPEPLARTFGGPIPPARPAHSN
jgi:hypothetical protein